MFAKKLTAQEIKEGILNCDLIVYKYLDKNFRYKTIAHVKANTGIQADADELYNDVIFQIYLNIENNKYIAEDKFEAYFMSIMRNKWIDILRHRKRKRKINTTELDLRKHQPIVDEKNAEPNHDLSNVACMNKHIKELGERDRTIVQLFYFKNLKQNAIAQKIGKTSEYVQQRIHKIRRRLKKELLADPNFNSIS